jgi:hypothetical protein
MRNSAHVWAIRRIALWDDFSFLIVCLIVVVAFALGIVCGGTIVEKKIKQLSVGAIHKTPTKGEQ